jgi:hypothetical protein
MRRSPQVAVLNWAILVRVVRIHGWAWCRVSEVGVISHYGAERLFRATLSIFGNETEAERSVKNHKLV